MGCKASKEKSSGDSSKTVQFSEEVQTVPHPDDASVVEQSSCDVHQDKCDSSAPSAASDEENAVDEAELERIGREKQIGRRKASNTAALKAASSARQKKESQHGESS